MSLTDEKRKRLKEIYASIATPAEVASMEADASTKKTLTALAGISEAVSIIDEARQDDRKEMLKIGEITEKNRKATNSLATVISSGFVQLAKAFSEGMAGIRKGYEGSQGQGNFALTIQNMAKDLADGLSAVKKSVDDKPVPVWRWPQYLYSGMRDQTFNPIDPAIAPFAITTSYDDIVLAYTGDNLTGVTYKKAGAVVAVLALSYDGDDNLTEVQRTT